MIFEGITCDAFVGALEEDIPMGILAGKDWTGLACLWRTRAAHRTNDAEDVLEESQRDGGQAVSICFLVIDHELLGLEDELNGTSAEKLQFLIKQLSFCQLFCISSSCSLVVKGIIRAESKGKVQCRETSLGTSQSFDIRFIQVDDLESNKQTVQTSPSESSTLHPLMPEQEQEVAGNNLCLLQ
jgi:hypothetical protein